MAIPAALVRFLADGSLTEFWAGVRRKLERSSLTPTGTVSVTLNQDGAERLSGVLGRNVHSGHIKVRLGEMDAALRRSAAQSGLADVTAAVTGSPLVDRRQLRGAALAASTELYASVDVAVNGVGLTPEQVPVFVAAVRRSGVLTNAKDAAPAAVSGFAAGWRLIVTADAFNDPAIVSNPVWGIGELATAATGTAHGFDTDRVASTLMMRALAMIFDVPIPTSSDGKRALWARAGVAVDDVSGTALTYGFRPPGHDGWSVMMRERANLGVVTHVTVQELRKAGNVLFVEPGTTVFACENPQVLSAAARGDIRASMLCLSGQGSAAGWEVLRKLIADGATVRYHGDFDWPGIQIAGRVHAAGGAMWRMGAADYVAALDQAGERIALEGKALPTPWDLRLRSAMTSADTAIHEEAIAGPLLADMAASSMPYP
ncbi:TIGR02679 family protein [Diaminobutyricibacter sp. McL0618]|uniref:TIGR02679 family protein n=1 Tax=Leifsonia sp. McL0618 TaxID=3415677 RepID=UPI003CF569B1